MEQPNRFWYLKNPYAWIVLVLGVITAVIIREWWVVLLGVIGFEFALLIDLTRGQSLGRSGRVRLARLEQEYRELKAEQARLIGAIEERDNKLANLSLGAPDANIVTSSPPAEISGLLPESNDEFEAENPDSEVDNSTQPADPGD